MSFVSITIFIIFVIRLLTNFEKTILFIGVWFVVLDMLVLPFKEITIFQALSLCSTLIFIIKKGKFNNTPTFLWICMSAAFISHAATNIFSGNPHWPTSILKIITVYFFPILLWNSIRNKNSINYFKHNLYIFLTLLLVYSLYEILSNSNPILNWLIQNDLTTNSVAVSHDIRFGIKRIQSFLALNGALGVCCTLNALFISYLLKNKFISNEKLYINYFFITCLYICAMLTGSRSIFLSVFVSLLYIINKSLIKRKETYIILVFLILIIPFIQEYLNNIIQSIKNTDSVGGSNTDMREGQLELSFYFLQQSPIFGNGIGYTFSYVTQNYQEMYGAESIWFSIMIDQGLLGILCYIICIISTSIYCIKKRLYIGIFIILTFIIAKTLSSIPGISESYFLIYIILISKIEMGKKILRTKNKSYATINNYTSI